MRIEYTDRAIRDLRKLDRADAQRIVHKVGRWAASGNPLQGVRKLKAPFEDIYRFRVGDFRVLFEIRGNAASLLLVLRVAHRKDVYE